MQKQSKKLRRTTTLKRLSMKIDHLKSDLKYYGLTQTIKNRSKKLLNKIFGYYFKIY
jgi:hypothetical protein